MRITETQRITINKLICERLSSNEGNLLSVNGFYNRKNDNIAQVLLNEAFEEDANGTTAYYVVKHPNGTILLFFSLKCGLLYDHFFDVNKFPLLKELVLFLETSVAEGEINEEEKKTIELLGKN
ncbi:MAG: hypothetical protein Q4D30_06215 [Bacteroidales bacterium]|nr:hypothetical protein [Bacteroidales bacterium]